MARSKPSKRRRSSGASLLEAVELGGGSATDLVQAMIEATPDDGEAAVVAAALKTAQQHRGGQEQALAKRGAERMAAIRRRRVRHRSVELVSFVERKGGSLAGLIDAIVVRGGDERNLELAFAALGNAAPTAGATAAAAPAAPAGDAGAGTSAAAEAGANGRRDGGTAVPKRMRADDAAAKVCTVCKSKPCVPDDKKACARCRELADRLKEKSDGECKLKHLRVAVGELGRGAKKKTLKRRALQLAGVGPAAAPEAEADPPETEAGAAAAVGDAQAETPAAPPGSLRAAHAAPASPSAAQAISVSSSADEAATGVGAPDQRMACKMEPGAPGAGTRGPAPHAGTPQACDRKPRLKTPKRESEAHTHAERPSAAAAASPAGPSGAAAAASSGPPAAKKARPAVKAEGASTQRQESGSGTAAAEGRDVKPCAICSSRPRTGRTSYCSRCASISTKLTGRGKSDHMRAAFRELGSDASADAVKVFVRRAQAQEALAEAAVE